MFLVLLFVLPCFVVVRIVITDISIGIIVSLRSHCCIENCLYDYLLLPLLL